MEILIFDMDGVLLKPHGYHRALQDTVRLAGEEIGFGRLHISNQQIHQFEALGIASEWHSSALCMSVLTLAKQAGEETSNLLLEPLFEALAAQPFSIIPRKRSEAAVAQLAQKAGIPADTALAWIQQSAQIDLSPTMNLFQSMILGDKIFEQMYGKPARMKTESYLKRFDENILSEETTAQLDAWANPPIPSAAIMTNRPSYGPENFLGAPDAVFGAELIGLAHLPLVGYGETTWLANLAGKPVAEVSKPNPEHALAAILSAAGWEIGESLRFVSRHPGSWNTDTLAHLRCSRISVFEDTPAGVMAVQAAGELLNQAGLKVTVQKIGIAIEPSKISGLERVGATVFEDINQALERLDNTGSLS